MQWGTEADAKLFMHVLKVHDIKLNLSALATAMGNDVTPKAISHRIAKLKTMAQDATTTSRPTTAQQSGPRNPATASAPSATPAAGTKRTASAVNATTANANKAGNGKGNAGGAKKGSAGGAKGGKGNWKAPTLTAAADDDDAEDEEMDVEVEMPAKKKSKKAAAAPASAGIDSGDVDGAA